MTQAKLATFVTVPALLLTTLTGCANNAARTSPSAQQGVDDVVQEQMRQDDQKAQQERAFVGDEGKTVKMEGPYYHTFYEATGKDYFYMVIQDATACCAQGLEFVWGDGSHAYSDEYPDDEKEVVVCGEFETYSEGTTSYVHLVDASLQAT